jgi:EAL domain-containing protein (putative c-di-GMP-specific phosphodiesterase class I)
MKRIELESALSDALVRDEFILHYQPQFHLSDNTVCGLEALLRWQPPGSELIYPLAFISIAEESRLTRLKIDRIFISGILDDGSDVAITKAIVLLGKTLGLDILAEGIETETQRQFLKEIGCQRGQGYICSKPLPADQIVDFLLELKQEREGTAFKGKLT